MSDKSKNSPHQAGMRWATLHVEEKSPPSQEILWGYSETKLVYQNDIYASGPGTEQAVVPPAAFSTMTQLLLLIFKVTS